jgi:hypothetical protein
VCTQGDWIIRYQKQTSTLIKTEHQSTARIPGIANTRSLDERCKKTKGNSRWPRFDLTQVLNLVTVHCQSLETNFLRRKRQQYPASRKVAAKTAVSPLDKTRSHENPARTPIVLTKTCRLRWRATRLPAERGAPRLSNVYVPLCIASNATRSPQMLCFSAIILNEKAKIALQAFRGPTGGLAQKTRKAHPDRQTVI